MRQRASLVFWGIAVCVAVVALGAAGIATGAVTTNPPEVECNPDGREFCLDVNTFSNITASDPTRDDGIRHTYVEWQMRNKEGATATLTHPAVTATLTDYCGSEVCEDQTSEFVSNGTQSVGVTYPNIPAGGNSGDVYTRFYFKTADVPATHTVIAVTGTVKERGNDQSCETGDANCDTYMTSVTNSYEPEEFNAYSFGLLGSSYHLASNNEQYSFDFTSASPSIFFAQFQALPFSTTFCFGSVPCFDRALLADTEGVGGFSSTNPVVFYARLLDPPGGVTAKNLAAIHIYDLITLQVSSNRLTAAGTSFARMDGLQIGTTKYFVVGYQSTDNSFQISLTKGGPPVSIADGEVSGKPIRIIGDQSDRIVGDQSDERSSNGCTTTFSSSIPIPSICATKVQGLPGALDAWVWDLGNGSIQY